jgi:ATP-binding cassette subfamily C protein
LTDRLKKIFYLLPKGDPIKLGILLLLMFVAAAMEVVGIGMIPAFVAIIADPERVMQIGWLHPVFTTLRITSQRDLLLWGAVALLSIFILKSIYIVAFNYFEAYFIYRRQYFISHRLMRAYMQAPYVFHLQRNTAELLRNVSSEVQIFIKSVVSSLLKMTRETVMVLAILIFLFAMEPLITLFLISLSVLGAGSFILLNKKKMKEYGQEAQKRRANMIKALQQGLGGIKDARVLNREDGFIERFRIETYKNAHLQAYIRFIQQVPRPVVETTAVLGVLMVAVLLIWQNRPMAAIIPILTLFAMATVRLMPSIQQIVSLYAVLRYNIVSVDIGYADLKNLEKFNATFNKDRRSKKKLTFNNEIRINDLSYHYPNSDEQAVNQISLKIKKGEAIAFVGASGAGKTTIVYIILGLLKPDEGGIYVDGKNIAEHLSAWQQNLGYIPQSIYLSDETLRANVAFGLPEEEIDDAKVMEAIRLAQLEALVKRLPDGLDTIVGEHGTRLSGGHQQRLGIARALYHNPDVLVMDEATSSLDNITEKRIMKAIEALKGERTLIMIAHRLTTVKNCDRLYFMEEGTIVQEGSYHDLVDSSVKFREMALEV